MDDEKVAYKGYELALKHGIKNICVHKGLFAPGVEKQFPHLRGFSDVADVGKAAKDWPQLNFVIYHSAYRHVGGDPKVARAEFERTGRISWTSDLADIPAEYGVSNVYGDVGQLFATTLVSEPNVCAALMAIWSRASAPTTSAGEPMRSGPALRNGRSKACAGSKSPRRCCKKHGFPALGAADGPIKTAIFGVNNAKLYNIQPKRAMLDLKNDGISKLKEAYERSGPERSNCATATWCRTGRSTTRCSHSDRRRALLLRSRAPASSRGVFSAQPWSFADYGDGHGARMAGIDQTRQFVPLKIAVLTVSDTRALADDKSGATLAERIEKAGHAVADRAIVTDDAAENPRPREAWIADPAIDVVITTGGTGFTGRDVTPEAIEPLFEKRMDGFATMFLMVSAQKIGTSAIQTRATAGVAGATYIFCLPGSPGACRDAWDDILVHQLDYRYRPCNFVEIMPRLDEHLRRAKAQGRDGCSSAKSARRCRWFDARRAHGPQLQIPGLAHEVLPNSSCVRW